MYIYICVYVYIYIYIYIYICLCKWTYEFICTKRVYIMHINIFVYYEHICKLFIITE